VQYTVMPVQVKPVKGPPPRKLLRRDVPLANGISTALVWLNDKPKLKLMHDVKEQKDTVRRGILLAGGMVQALWMCPTPSLSNLTTLKISFVGSHDKWLTLQSCRLGRT